MVVLSTTPLSGGQVGEVLKVETPDGPVVVKRQPGGAPPGFFAAEAHGLEQLRAAGALRIPTVLEVTDDHLMLEYLAPTAPRADFALCFAQGLARQHRVTADAFGLERDNFLGPYVQPNAWTDRWPTFYAQKRLMPQLALAARDAKLPTSRAEHFAALLAALPTVLAEFNEPPALIHGDLWSGNYLHTIHGPALIDPAVYFAPRELELAYIELFGGFPDGFVAAYHQAYPLDPGYERRRPLHQLYPLLVHLNYFGERYGPMVDAALAEVGKLLA